MVDIVAEMGLQLLRASPVEKAQSAIGVPALNFVEIRQYNWPAARNGSKFGYDKMVLVGVFPDGALHIFGSIGVYADDVFVSE